MNDLPRQTLSRIIAKHGRGICDAPKRLEAMLRDLCGAHRREINIIMGALAERVATDLTTAGSSVPREALFARLAARLRDNLAYTPEAARWGVRTWAVALGIMTEEEFQERALTESSETGNSSAPPPVQGHKPLEANPANVNPQATDSQRGTTNTPLQQTSRPPKMRRPPSVQTPAPAPRQNPMPPPGAIVPEPPLQDISVSLPSGRRSRRGLTLRGCVIMFILAIVLIVAAVFVVPAVIMILREEQAQPSINDPRVR